MSDIEPAIPATLTTPAGRDERPMMVDARDDPPVASNPVPEEATPERNYEAEAARHTGPKTIFLGGVHYSCANQIPALLLADLVDKQAGLKEATEEEGPQGDKLRAAIEILDFFVLDGDLDRIKARLRDKENPIGFPEIMPEVSRLLPIYMGSSMGKPSG